MNNKGRKHKCGLNNVLHCKSSTVVLTRPQTSMSSKGKANSVFTNKYSKKKWIKRMRGYMKSPILRYKLHGIDEDY